MKRWRLYALCILPLVAACSVPFVGVMVAGNLTQLPSNECIEAELKKAEDISYKDYRLDEYSSPHEGSVHMFRYDHDGYELKIAIISISLQNRQTGVIEQDLYYHNGYDASGFLFASDVTQDDVDKLRPVISAIQRRLEAKCNLHVNSSGFSEMCGLSKGKACAN